MAYEGYDDPRDDDEIEEEDDFDDDDETCDICGCDPCRCTTAHPDDKEVFPDDFDDDVFCVETDDDDDDMLETLEGDIDLGNVPPGTYKADHESNFTFGDDDDGESWKNR